MVLEVLPQLKIHCTVYYSYIQPIKTLLQTKASSPDSHTVPSIAADHITKHTTTTTLPLGVETHSPHQEKQKGPVGVPPAVNSRNKRAHPKQPKSKIIPEKACCTNTPASCNHWGLQLWPRKARRTEREPQPGSWQKKTASCPQHPRGHADHSWDQQGAICPPPALCY